MTKYIEVSWVFSDTGKRYHAAIEKSEQLIELILHTRKQHGINASVTIGPNTLTSISNINGEEKP
jgi:hypothetical protein